MLRDVLQTVGDSRKEWKLEGEEIKYSSQATGRVCTFVFVESGFSKNKNKIVKKGGESDSMQVDIGGGNSGTHTPQ